MQDQAGEERGNTHSTTNGRHGHDNNVIKSYLSPSCRCCKRPEHRFEPGASGGTGASVVALAAGEHVRRFHAPVAGDSFASASPAADAAVEPAAAGTGNPVLPDRKDHAWG